MLTGKNLIAGEPVESADGTFTAGGELARFEEASAAHLDRALNAATGAFDAYRRLPADTRAAFLDRIAAAIEGNDRLIEVAHVETALPVPRLTGERTRTAGTRPASTQRRMVSALTPIRSAASPIRSCPTPDTIRAASARANPHLGSHLRSVLIAPNARR